MDTRHLEEYITFSESLNYTQAAKKLYVTRPALQAHIRALEAEVGGSFFVNQDEKLALTPLGKLFLKQARILVDHCNEMVGSCRDFVDCSASLSLGFLEYPWLEKVFLDARDNLQLTVPHYRLQFHHTSKMLNCIQSVSEGLVDIALFSPLRNPNEQNQFDTKAFPDEISYIYLGEKRLYFFTPNKEIPLVNGQTTLDEISNLSLLLGETENMHAIGKTLQDYASQNNRGLDAEYQFFQSYRDYILGQTPDTFGIILEGHTIVNEKSDAFKVFSIEGFPVFVDLFFLFDEARFNTCGKKFLDELAKTKLEYAK